MTRKIQSTWSFVDLFSKISYCCKSRNTSRDISILTRRLPTQLRLPKLKGKEEKGCTFDSALRSQRSGVKFSGSPYFFVCHFLRSDGGKNDSGSRWNVVAANGYWNFCNPHVSRRGNVIPKAFFDQRSEVWHGRQLIVSRRVWAGSNNLLNFFVRFLLDVWKLGKTVDAM